MVNETFNILKSYEKQKNDIKPENLSDTSWAAGYQRVLDLVPGLTDVHI